MHRTAGALALLAALAPLARAVPLDALDHARDWRLGALELRGNDAIGARELRDVMITKPRRWFAIWRAYPPFDPITFRSDLERLARLYRSRGYYHAEIGHDVKLLERGDAVRAIVQIAEGPPVRVTEVRVTLSGAPLPAAEQTRLRAELPLHVGDVFTEPDYDRARGNLRTYYRERGFARVKVTKAARVDVDSNTATVAYTVASGPPSVFGTVTVDGTRDVDPGVVRREIAFEEGQPFRQSLLEKTREQLLGLKLFRSVRIDEDERDDPRVDLVVRVTEARPREIRFGVGFDTEDQVRGLATWRHYNFLGGARQLGFSGEASLISRSLAADLLQPHFPGRNNRSRLIFSQSQEDEETFLLNRTRFTPRVEWAAGRGLTGFVFHRTEFDTLSGVSSGVEAALPGAVEDGFLSGVGIGLDLNRTDDLLNPTRGVVTNLTIEPVGGFLGGDFAFVRAVAEGRVYQPLVGRLIGAGRLRLGVADPIAGSREIPLFERFYVGGLNSVRGYGRHRIGPLADDDPLGGRTLVELSAEFRHPITDKIGIAIFGDGGQVGLESFDLRFGDLRYGAGAGIRYLSPVGPLRLDLGFPFDPPPGDASFQVHVSLGAAF